MYISVVILENTQDQLREIKYAWAICPYILMQGHIKIMVMTQAPSICRVQGKYTNGGLHPT